MLERDVIQVRGFRNTETDGKVDGFQFRVRTLYYRGAWLSMYRFGNVTVDGEVFTPDQLSLEFNGIEYSVDQLLKEGDVQWDNTKAAVVKVKKEGGLASGYHDVSFEFSPMMSYIPPLLLPDATGKLSKYEKRMILV